MTPDQRFTLIMFMLGLIAALTGWYGRRIIKRNDARWDMLDTLSRKSELSESERPMWEKRQERTEQSIAKLLEIVTEQGLQFARHEGYHESHDKNSDSPLLGR